MNEREYEIGDRVIGSISGIGVPRAGVVTAVLSVGRTSYAWNGERRYMVLFDRDQGHSGPCIVHRAEDEREAVTPLSGKAS